MPTPVETDQEGAGTDTPASRACASGASTGVVPHATGDSSTHTTPDPPEEGSDSIHTPRRPPRGKAPSGCVGFLRQWYRDCQISEEATKPSCIMEAKILQDIRLTFGKWVGRCGEQDSDPISCPIGDMPCPSL